MKLILIMYSIVIALDKLNIIQNLQTTILIVLLTVFLIRYSFIKKKKLFNKEKAEDFRVLEINQLKINNSWEYLNNAYNRSFSNEIKSDKEMLFTWFMMYFTAVICNNMSTLFPIVNLVLAYFILNKKYNEMSINKDVLEGYLKEYQDIDKYELLSVILTLKYTKVPVSEPRLIYYLKNQLKESYSRNKKNCIRKLISIQESADVQRAYIPDE